MSHRNGRDDPRRESWRALLVVLLCLGALAGLLYEIGQVAVEQIAATTWGASSREGHGVLMGIWRFASAHENVFALNEARQQRLRLEQDAAFLVAQDVSTALTLALPFLALFAALALPLSRRVRLWAFVGLALGVSSLVVACLWGIVRQQTWTMEPGAWSRLLVWIAFLTTYFTLFLLLGTWIRGVTRSTKKAVWICLSLIFAMLLIQGARPLLMRVDGSRLPPVPTLPTEVRLSLFRPSGEPRVTEDRVEMVEDYLASVDAYSEEVHKVVADRYTVERSWHVVSPQLLLRELAGQLLQSEYADIVDVVYSGRRSEPGLAASLRAVWPEAVWLLVLCALAGTAATVVGRSQGRIKR
jgi:hypothetical protein